MPRRFQDVENLASPVSPWRGLLSPGLRLGVFDLVLAVNCFRPISDEQSDCSPIGDRADA